MKIEMKPGFEITEEIQKIASWLNALSLCSSKLFSALIIVSLLN